MNKISNKISIFHKFLKESGLNNEADSLIKISLQIGDGDTSGLSSGDSEKKDYTGTKEMLMEIEEDISEDVEPKILNEPPLDWQTRFNKALSEDNYIISCARDYIDSVYRLSMDTAESSKNRKIITQNVKDIISGFFFIDKNFKYHGGKIVPIEDCLTPSEINFIYSFFVEEYLSRMPSGMKEMKEDLFHAMKGRENPNKVIKDNLKDLYKLPVQLYTDMYESRANSWEIV